MEFNNKTVLIIGLIIGGLLSLYLHQENIASAIFGGLVGYLSKDIPKEVYDRFNASEVEDVDDEP